LKRLRELRRLSEDHHHGLVLARKALAARDSVAAAKVWREVEEKFPTELEAHFGIEEDHLAPPLRRAGEEGLVKRLLEEHRRLRSVLGEASERSVHALHQFGTALEAHIRFEERELFEAAQRLLTPEELESIEKACRRLPPRGGG